MRAAVPQGRIMYGYWGKDLKNRKRKTRDMRNAMPEMLKELDSDGSLRLVRVWRQWDEMLGEFASMVRPLGHRGKTLILYAEDPMIAAEAAYFSQIITDRINSHFGEEIFDKVRFELLNGRVPLGKPSATARREEPLRYKKPKVLGTLNDQIDPESPVGRCYRAYQKIFDDE